MQRGLGRVETDELRLARLGLAAAMILAAALLLWAGRGTSFFSDELYYFGRVGVDGLAEPFNLSYVLEPLHGHLTATGKLVYELLFATAGTHYFWYRLVEVVLLAICVALFFELARVRVGPWAALAGSVVLLFLGAGWEVLLWPFDLHTLLPLAACLTAVLALERAWPRADAVSCALLVLAMATIEIGVAFAVGIAVGVLMRPDRRSRAWVFAIPLVLYAVWSLWARHFGQSQIDLTQLSALATSMPGSLAASVSSLTGLIDPGGDRAVDVVGGLGPELVLAVLLVIAFVWRISVAPVRQTTWIFLATLLTYWALITLSARLPDTARYMPVDGAAGVADRGRSGGADPRCRKLVGRRMGRRSVRAPSQSRQALRWPGSPRERGRAEQLGVHDDRARPRPGRPRVPAHSRRPRVHRAAAAGLLAAGRCLPAGGGPHRDAGNAAR